MAKPSITKRSVKGAALTYSELDTNFDNLKDATLTLTAGSGGTQVISDLNGTITLVAGSGITLAGDNTAKTITITGSGGGGSQSPWTANIDMAGFYLYDSVGTPSINEDLYFLQNSTGPIGNGTLTIKNKASYATSITLTDNEISVNGGLQFDNLTTAERTALTASSGMLVYNTTTGVLEVYQGSTWDTLLFKPGGANSDITIAPNGTGNVNLDSDTLRVGDSNSPATITTNGTGNLTLNTNSGTNSSSIVILNGANGDISIEPNGSADFRVNTTYMIMGGAGSYSYVTTDTDTLNLYLGTNENASGPVIGLIAASMTTSGLTAGSIFLTPSGSGKLQLDGLYWPTADGTANQVLKTDGAGNLGWVTAGSGFSTVVLSFGTAVDVGGGIEKCTVSETIDTGSICTVSGYDFTLPAGTYIVSLATKFHSGLSSSFASGSYSWTSVSGDATISSVATMAKPTTTSGITYQNITTITLTQTSTFYQRAPTNNAFYNSSAIPNFWTFVKTA